ncbi:MAG TPA: SAM-dependent methyltransferase [Thermoanaerobaculia bacterium]|nr:SAM-dependent methyltransferase [Thermoanaerobaculia bacterium]
MPATRDLSAVIQSLLAGGDLSFRDFMELALYHPELGYYMRRESPVGKDGDYITSPTLTPVFAYAIGRLIAEFLARHRDEVSAIVDLGCGDGTLLHDALDHVPRELLSRARVWGVDRSLDRVPAAIREEQRTVFVDSIGDVDRCDSQFVISNELFDAFPCARLVRRGEHLHELWVTERDGALDWTEHEAPGAYEDYLASRGIGLEDGQFADLSLDWEACYEEIVCFVSNGLIVTFDYGFTDRQLFHPRARRFGTAASYSGQRVGRDLLARPGEQDLTAHINFSDLQRAGERHDFVTLFFDRQARFLLSLGITDHELFRPAQDVSIDSVESGLALIDAREEAKRLVLPDGIGHDIRVLVQGIGPLLDGWSFQKQLF